MRYEADLAELRLENQALSDKIHENAQTLVANTDQIQQLEFDLAKSQEKHRTCQMEVTEESICSDSHSANCNIYHKLLRSSICFHRQLCT